MPKRVAVFIDAENLRGAIRDAGHDSPNLDVPRLCSYLIAGREIVRIYYYTAQLRQDVNAERYAAQQRFFGFLRTVDYLELRLGRLAGRPPNPLRQKGVDVRIAIDMVQMAARDQFDVAVLVSEDSDLVEAVDTVKSFGKHVEVAFMRRSSRALRDVADVFTEIDITRIHQRGED